jgi:acetylglutamate kinase
MTIDSADSALEQARILMQALPHMLRYRKKKTN